MLPSFLPEGYKTTSAPTRGQRKPATETNSLNRNIQKGELAAALILTLILLHPHLNSHSSSHYFTLITNLTSLSHSPSPSLSPSTYLYTQPHPDLHHSHPHPHSYPHPRAPPHCRNTEREITNHGARSLAECTGTLLTPANLRHSRLAFSLCSQS